MKKKAEFTIKTFNSHQLGLLHFIGKAQGESALFLIKKATIGCKSMVTAILQHVIFS